MFVQWPPAQENYYGAACTRSQLQSRRAECRYWAKASQRKQLCVCEFFLAERKMRIFSPRLWN
jgi:hypothetical protein